MAFYRTGQIKDILTLADNYAKNFSTCKKTHVGCYLVAETEWRTVISKGCNSNTENSCKKLGCLREELFGNNSKEHRKTCRCYGNHAEQDALNRVPEDKKHLLEGATAFVTRYPCDECVEALINAGIKKIVYGREFEISEKAKALLGAHKVTVMHLSGWNCDQEDVNN